MPAGSGAAPGSAYLCCGRLLLVRNVLGLPAQHFRETSEQSERLALLFLASEVDLHLGYRPVLLRPDNEVQGDSILLVRVGERNCHGLAVAVSGHNLVRHWDRQSLDRLQPTESALPRPL